ncbi:alpha/beta hydrolase [Rugosimonospora acidiphila]|uniref:alpha/beta hydrolase n=1 Tax=Rugosimonospora acidiphila TaxID=556531 RepID=UPI003CD07A16
MTRQRAAILVITLFALAMAGCTPSLRWVSAPAAGRPPGAAETSAPGTGGTAVRWTPCQQEASALLTRLPSGITYDCATIEVPQDWAAPDNGKTFDLALTRVHSANQTARLGSLVVNPGGPGASGVDLAMYLSTELPQDVLRRFDVVGFDPRGVGKSDPVKCFTDADEDATFGANPDPVSQADFDAEVALNQKMAQGCQAKYGDTLRLFSTEQAARDLDAVRAAVGDSKLTYLGYSYGSLLGATYAQLFPKNIRAMVLDGAIDPTASTVTAVEGQAQGFEHAYDEFAAWCKQNSCPAGADPRATLTGLLDTAKTQPAHNADGRDATGGWILTGVAESLYSQEEWPLLGQALGDLTHGNPAKIFQLADAYAERDSSGHYTNMFDIFNTVECDDDNSGETVSQARALQSQWRTKYPIFGTQMALGLISCAVWPAKRDPYPTGKAVGAPPVVVIGTTNDPATPYEQTAKLASMLGVGRVLTWQGEGHTAYPQTECIRQAVDGYLVDLKVPAAGTTCPAQ